MARPVSLGAGSNHGRSRPFIFAITVHGEEPMTEDDRLLIVDDEAAIRFQFRGIAEALGYEAVSADTALA